MRRPEMERTAGIEPASSGWKPEAQPLYHARFVKKPAANGQGRLSTKEDFALSLPAGFEPAHALAA